MKNLLTLTAVLLSFLVSHIGLAPSSHAQAAKDGKGNVKPRQWVHACAQKNTGCEARYVIVDSKKNAAFVWTVKYSDKKSLVSTVSVPHGVLLPKGVMVKWPAGEALKVDYRVCTRSGGCAANVPVPKDIQKIAASRNAVASFTVFAPSGKDLTFQVALAGLDKAIAKLK